MAMKERRQRRPRRRENTAEASRTPLGGVRRTQMITTYGVGALVAIDEKSYVVSGIDSWKVDDSTAIFEPRLQHWLGVQGFRLPPASNPPVGDGVRVRLFPEMYSCPKCHELKRFREFGSPRGKSLCGACEESLSPSRFVVACENGHLDDFPYFAWVHKRTSPVSSETGVRHELSLHSTGRTASLRSVVVRCSCGKKASLEGAFGGGAMQALGISCSGRRPWLGAEGVEVGCTSAPRTLQRGSSAAWFPLNRSALSIPPWSATLQKRVHDHYGVLEPLIAGKVDDALLDKVIEGTGLLQGSLFTRQEIVNAVRQRMELANTEPESEAYGGFEPAERLRREEYEQLMFGTAELERDQDFECVKPEGDRAALPFGIERSMQVKRLREVRALQAFTRVQAPDVMSPGTQPAALALEAQDWLPAVEVSGEGVFLTLDNDLLHSWERRPGTVQRMDRIRREHTRVLRSLARKSSSGRKDEAVDSPITPRYVLLHTLAHILINEWSLGAGYPAASLRERLYVSDDMAGMLIYTATSDSAGSLGGVVAQGEYKQLRATLESALNRAAWCSQDPPCMESEASGVNGLNLAACYACVLLPETSCETNNSFLDRGVLLGTPEDSSVGFFNRDN
ncbi:DrmB family protein [Nocardiopsis sp. NPDC055824]